MDLSYLQAIKPSLAFCGNVKMRQVTLLLSVYLFVCINGDANSKQVDSESITEVERSFGSGPLKIILPCSTDVPKGKCRIFLSSAFLSYLVLPNFSLN